MARPDLAPQAAGGRPADPLGKSGAAIAEALLRETAAVADFVEALAGRGLLVPAGVNQDHPIAERPSFARLLVVDHVRYGALPASVAEDWRRRGWSALVAAQVRSLGNWRRLAEREAARSAAAAVPPATVSSKEPA